jgi:hypothetical protein
VVIDRNKRAAFHRNCEILFGPSERVTDVIERAEVEFAAD